MENEKITGPEQERIFYILESISPAVNVNKRLLSRQITNLLKYSKFKLRNELKTKIKEVLDEKN